MNRFQEGERGEANGVVTYLQPRMGSSITSQKNGGEGKEI